MCQTVNHEPRLLSNIYFQVGSVRYSYEQLLVLTVKIESANDLS